MANRPEKSIKAGCIEAAIFENDIVKGGKKLSIKKVSFQKRYKSAEGEWKSTNSLDVSELPKAIFVLCKAYEYLCSNNSDDSNGDSEQ